MNNYTFINGGVTSPQGFTANGICAGVKPAWAKMRNSRFSYLSRFMTIAPFNLRYVKRAAFQPPQRVTCVWCA